MLDKLELVARQFEQKGAGDGGSNVSVQGPPPRHAQLQLLLGPRDSDEQQAAFFFQFVRFVATAFVWQDAFFERHDVYDGKLESLGGMQGHERNFVDDRFPAIGVGHERSLFEKRLQAAVFGVLRVKLARRRDQLLHVREPLLIFFVVRSVQPIPVSRIGQHAPRDRFDRFLNRRVQRVVQRDEAVQGRGGALGQALHLAGFASRIEHRDSAPPRMILDPLQRRLADSSRRCIDHAPECRIVSRVIQQVEVGQHVLHLSPLVELVTIDNLVRNASLDEGLLEHPRQGIGAIKDGEVARPPTLVDLPRHVVGDPLGFLLA